MRFLPALVVLVLLLAAPAAHGATLGVTGTDGRDDLVIEFEGSGDKGAELVITPPLSLSGDLNCSTETDPLTGRPLRHRCGTGPTNVALTVDLRKGDDSFDLEPFDNNASVVAAGGPGNDRLFARSPGTIQLRGDDGDDTLIAPGVGQNPVTFDGGLGRDLAEWGNGGIGGQEPGGVTASLATGSATLVVGRTTRGATGIVIRSPVSRTDTLIAIERLSGTPQGDVLNGGALNDELLGQGGPDDLNGSAGNDSLSGGDGADLLVPGKGVETLDGGGGIDEFRVGDGGDTFLTRDGFIEQVTCVTGDTVVNDLVDKVSTAASCLSISTAQAKHRFDTRLSRGRIGISRRRAVRALVKCPRAKPDRCAGTLLLRRGGTRGRALANGRFRLRPGQARRVALRLSDREAARLRGRSATLEAAEVDGDGRARSVIAALRIRR